MVLELNLKQTIITSNQKSFEISKIIQEIANSKVTKALHRKKMLTKDTETKNFVGWLAIQGIDVIRNLRMVLLGNYF